MFGLELLAGGPLTTTFIIGVLTILLLYWYSTRNLNYWKKKGVVNAQPFTFLENNQKVIDMPAHEIDIRRYKKYGKIYGDFEANTPMLSVADLTLIRKLLAKDFSSFPNRRTVKSGNPIHDSMLTIIQGEDWKRIRSIVSPTFSTGKIKRMLGIMTSCSKTLIQNLKVGSEAGKPFNAKSLFGAFTMDVIASSAFSTKIDSHNDPDNQFVKAARNVFRHKKDWRSIFSHLAPKLSKFLGVTECAPSGSDFFKEATLKIIEERKKTGQTRNDFLQLLMDTVKELSEGKELDLPEKDSGDIALNYGEDVSSHPIFKNVSSKYLSMDELVGQCVIFFLAGYETTASTLSFVNYMLALNPDVQEKLREEIDSVLSETNGELTYGAIQNMKYLDNVISETLRLCPPVIRLERIASTDYKLGDTGIIIEKGTLVTIPTYVIHRDPQLYPEPDKFDPDRFNPAERARRDPYAYLPFGSGPRNCVAMRFALMEVKVCLAHVISNFIIKTSPETKVPLEFNMGNKMLFQPKEILLGLELRQDSPLVK